MKNTPAFPNMNSPDSSILVTDVPERVGGVLEVFVNISQMTVSQMSLTEMTDSPQQRLHWAAEQVLNWSRLPVVHVRATVFLQHPVSLDDSDRDCIWDIPKYFESSGFNSRSFEAHVCEPLASMFETAP